MRRLSRAGELTRALEVAEAWLARDRQDAEALTAKADLLGRLGRRDEALRTLTGTVDLEPDSESLQKRLADAFERAGQPERACAHRIALADIDGADPDALAAAMRCERALGRDGAAQRLMDAVREPSVRTRAERAAAEDDETRRFRGDFTIDAEWDERVDLDVTIVTSHGTRLSWMGGRTTVVGEDVNREGHERLGLRWTAPGSYTIEVDRTDPFGHAAGARRAPRPAARRRADHPLHAARRARHRRPGARPAGVAAGGGHRHRSLSASRWLRKGASARVSGR